MCGIGGILYFDGRPVDRSLLDTMSETMRDRGPDDKDEYAGPGIGLVHRRLSIIDLSPRGNCPMSNEDGSIRLVFNGEVYNYLELREDLSNRGHRFRSTSDTEVIVHGYEEWGIDAISRLDGMFAIGIWDEREMSLLLARDRLGEKPLYYHREPGMFAFASSLNALTSVLGPRARVNPMSLIRFLSNGYIQGPETAWKEISQLEPAHHMVVSINGDASRSRYWDFPGETWTGMSTRDAEELVENGLIRSVKRRLVADVPVGGFLSGGIDSSLVMAMAARHAPRIQTFTVGYEEEDMSEIPYAREVAAHIGSDHHELVVTDDDLLGILPRLIRCFGQPYGDSSCIPTYIVSRLAGGHVKVCLSGDGGDEAFAGYRRALFAWLASVWGGVVPRPVRMRAVPQCASMERGGDGTADWWSNLVRMNRLSLDAEGVTRHNTLSWLHTLKDICGDFLSESLREIGGEGSFKYLSGRTEDGFPKASVLRKVLLDDYSVQLPDDYLVKVDVMSMAASLEVRAPFLDHHLVESAWRMPDKHIMRRGGKKWLLKRIAGRYVPGRIVTRPKMGFALPMKEWWNSKLYFVLRELMADSRAVRWGWVRPGPVFQSLEEHRGGIRRHDTRLWYILCLELWGRIMLERSLHYDTSLLDMSA